MAEWTGLEPATPGVTGRYSNQLNYHSRLAAINKLPVQTQFSWWVLTGSNRRHSPCKGDALPAELSTPDASVYCVLQALASTELGHFGSLYLDGGSGARIAPSARSAFTYVESTKTHQGHHVAFLQSLLHCINSRVESTSSGRPWKCLLSRRSHQSVQICSCVVPFRSSVWLQEAPVAGFITSRKSLCQAVFRPIDSRRKIAAKIIFAAYFIHRGRRR